MFESPTLFVVGAGASAEAGLPIGNKLTHKIANLLRLSVEFGNLKSGDFQIFEALRELVNSGGPWGDNNFIGSGRAVSEAMELALSIDTFLESHASNAEFVMLGKLGIVRAIAAEERASKLKPNGYEPFRIGDVVGTWYVSLAQQLFTGIPVEHPERAFDKVGFVVFNYDRCLEVFLIRALEVYFRISRDEAASIVEKVPIVHAYGAIGAPFSRADDFVPFAPDRIDLVAAAGRIKTFSESVESEVSGQISTLVRAAETLVFLGFGFHDQNMRLLDGGPKPLGSTLKHRVYATTYGLSDSDTEFVRGQISDLLLGALDGFGMDRDWIFTNGGECVELFKHYWRSITS